MKTLKNYLVILSSFCLFSCTEEIISVDLETAAAPRLVIDASIDWVKNTTGNEQKIKLSTTTGYYSNEFPTVSGANIVITNSNATFHFIENTGTGEYICTDFQPIIGETYTLTISLNGEIYAATETLMNVPNLENNIEQNNNGGMSGDEVELAYHYQDDPTEQNNYLYSVKNPRVAFPEYEAENDENNQGNLVPVYYSNEDENLRAGDVVHIKLYGISKRYYEYIRKLLVASGADTGPFPTTPGPVRGNIVNQTNATNFAYGYFRLSEVDTREYIVQ